MHGRQSCSHHWLSVFIANFEGKTLQASLSKVSPLNKRTHGQPLQMIGENEGYVKGYRLDGISSISYIPDFLSQYEAAKLTENVRNLKYGWTEVCLLAVAEAAWLERRLWVACGLVQVKGRRLQNFGGRVEHGVLLQVPFPR